jgi:hypothetical protein
MFVSSPSCETLGLYYKTARKRPCSHLLAELPVAPPSLVLAHNHLHACHWDGEHDHNHASADGRDRERWRY